MSKRSNRTRHTVSPLTLRLARAAGWRYSASREAWVHRIGRGRRGPVLVPRPATVLETGGVPDLHLFEGMLQARKPKIRPEAERTPLPRRIQERPIRHEQLHRPVYAVEARLHDDEAPRLVRVDGRPPRRGTDLGTLRSRDALVLPFHKDLATA